MLVKTFSIAPYGMSIIRVSVETYVASRGFPSFDIVGLPGKEVSESKHRVITALKNSGIQIPSKKIVLNLAPADIPKVGSFLDLPIAISLYSALHKIELDDSCLYFGELSLDGTLRYTKGAFLLALYASENNIRDIYVPNDCVPETTSFEGLRVYPVGSLKELINHVSMGKRIIPNTGKVPAERSMREVLNINSVIGQDHAKEAVIISASGGHNLLLNGPPGVGKTMLSKAYKSLLPTLRDSESIEVTKVYALGNQLEKGTSIITEPPYRSPHHTISYTGMVGGGSVPSPGEISFSHKGVLFLDEFTEFPRKVLESLRQPMESGKIYINRSKGMFEFPCDFTVVAACNPCACGFLNHPTKECVCTFGQLQNYKRKLSGPIIDRLDMFVTLNVLDPTELTKLLHIENTDIDSTDIKLRVQRAREIQYKRQGYLNSKMTNKDIYNYCVLSNDAQLILNKFSKKGTLSMRSYTKILKVAKTLSDLEERSVINDYDVSIALKFRK